MTFSFYRGLVESDQRPLGRVYRRQGLSHTLLYRPTRNSLPCNPKGSIERRKESCVEARGQGPNCQEGDRRSLGRQSRLLQPSLRGSEEKWQTPANNRPISLEPLHSPGALQNGDNPNYSGVHSHWRMGRLHRPEGRLLTRPHSPVIQKVSTLSIRRTCIPVSCSPFRDKYGSVRIHQTDGSRSGGCTKSWITSDPVFRRLVVTPTSPLVITPQPTVSLGNYPGPRSDSEQGQIRPDPFADLHLRGDVFSDTFRSGVCSPTKDRRNSDVGQISATTSVTDCKSLPLPSGSPQCSGGLSPAGKAPHEASPNVPLVSLETDQGSSGCLDPHSPSSHPTSSMVVGQEEVVRRSSDLSSRSLLYSSDGRFSHRLGSPPGAHGPPVSGRLVSTGQGETHQQLRVEGCFPCSPSGTPSCQRTLRHGCVGQFDSGLLHSETGRYPLDLSLRRDERPATLVRRAPYFAQSETHPRAGQCPSRLPVKGGERDPLGVVSAPSSSRTEHSALGSPNGGLVRQSAEPQASSVCVTGTGHSGNSTRCIVNELERNGRLCVSSLQPSEHSAKEDRPVELSDDPGRPFVATQGLVQPATILSGRDPKGPTTESGPSIATRRAHVARQPVLPPPSRVEALRRSIKKRGFSSKAATLIAKAKRPSTSTVYDAKWKVFTSWCLRRKVDPLRPSLGKVADFLIHLFQERNCSPSTIKGYRSALSNTLKFGGGRGRDIGSDPRLSELIRHFERARPATRSVAPKWNLSCVLWSLTKTPYEPMHSASLLNVTVKTVFLLAFASAKRRSELHALSIDEGSLRFGKDSVTLLLEPGFLPKTQVPNKLPDPIVIPSLDQVCGPNDEDRLLCPVRALKFYLDRTKTVRLSRKRLFIPVKGKGDVSPATISRWLRTAILGAYENLSSSSQALLNIKAHETRALATSWAYHNRIPSEDILQAASWMNHSTFSNFYLRSLSNQEEGLFRLGPLVSAQRVISR